MYTISLTVGDPSGDGHDKRETFLIKSSLSMKNLKKAYDAGCDVLGFNLIEDHCSEFEDNYLPVSVYDELVMKFYEVNPAMAKDSDVVLSEELDCSTLMNDKVWVDSDLWVSLVLMVCSIGDPSLVYEYVNGTEWAVGGYGIFFL